MAETIRLAIVDDHEIARLGIRRMLEGEDHICLVGEAGNGEEALALARRERPQVMLVDVKLPDISGIEVVRRLKKDARTCEVQAVVLTIYDDLDTAAEAIRAGAIGYILKDSGREQLVKAIASAAEGVPMVSSRITQKLVSALYGQGGSAAPTSPRQEALFSLTPRESEVLRLVARGCGNKAVARELGITVSTVMTHLKNIYRKLGVEDRAQVIIKAIREGMA